tara:strand:+ start:439 stop:1404 length:966 start_codon:yes stop_codon:yes gene_type:complete
MELNIDQINADFLPKNLLQKAYQEKWFKIFVSKKLNGLEADLCQGLQIIRHCNKIMGSFGWCVNLGAGANYFSGFYTEAGAKEVFLKPDCVLAGSGGFASEIIAVKEGYLVSGKWGKATGTSHATHFTCNGILPNGKKVSLTLNPKDVTIDKNWSLFAMKSSSSYEFSAVNAFVPHDLIFTINKPQNEQSYSIHQLPFDCFAEFCMTATAIGLAEGIVNKLESELLKPAAKAALVDLETCIQGRLNIMNRLAIETWDKLKNEDQKLTFDAISESVKITGKELFKSVNQLYYDAGLLMADERKLAHHHYKDFLLAIQHTIFK